MNGAKGAAPNLLLDDVLVDAMLGGSVILAGRILGACIECFLPRSWTQSAHKAARPYRKSW